MKTGSIGAFQPPRKAAVPQFNDSQRVRNPIDAFVLRKLSAAGIDLSPEADRPTLMRRAYFDLTGLPPTPAEIEAYLRDDQPLAYERLVDRLLDSPRYGERWARFWLDAAGYADSEGKRSADPLRPYAYKYRDYVIRALNDDKPYGPFPARTTRRRRAGRLRKCLRANTRTCRQPGRHRFSANGPRRHRQRHCQHGRRTSRSRLG